MSRDLVLVPVVVVALFVSLDGDEYDKENDKDNEYENEGAERMYKDFKENM